MVAKQNPPALEVTAIVRDRRLVIRFTRKEVAIPRRRVIAFLWMVAQRRNTDSGYTPHPLFEPDKQAAHPTITRLRANLDATLGCGAAKKIFKEVGFSTYQLLIDKSEIVVCPEIRDLVPWYLPANLVDALLPPTASAL